MTLNTINAGITTNFSTQLNQNFEHVFWELEELYSGSALDVSIVSTGTSVGTYTFSTSMTTVNYVMLHLLGNVICEGTGSIYGYISLKIETSQLSASSWTTRLDTTLEATRGNSSSDVYCNGLREVKFYYAPTAGEKSNGLDFKVTITGTSVSNGNASFTLVQAAFFVQ